MTNARKWTGVALAAVVVAGACDQSPTEVPATEDFGFAALVGTMPPGAGYEVTVCKEGPAGVYNFTASTTTAGTTLDQGASFTLTAGDAALECKRVASTSASGQLVTVTEVGPFPANTAFKELARFRYATSSSSFDYSDVVTDPYTTVQFGNDFGWVLIFRNEATPPPPPPPSLDGRMTGGGSVFMGDTRFTHGFELHCDPNDLPNNLEVNWPDNRFHLTSLTSVVCTDDPALNPLPRKAGFDTYTASGVGLWNGQPGATIDFVFTDDGEPGTKDWAEMTITPPGGSPVVVSGYLTKGNHQAHWVN